MAGITATGLGSNLDVTGLVSKLMEVERQPLTKLDQKEAAAQVKISALAQFRGSLSSFQGTLKALADPSNYQISKATIDDASVAVVTATASAAVGSYSLEVQNLAKSQKLTMGSSFNAVTDTVGTGTLTIQYGTYTAPPTPPGGDGGSFALNSQKATQTVNIDAAHSSLQGVRDAINAAKIGVSANIVNDGTGFKLVLSSKDTGAANSLKISVSDGDLGDSDASGLSRLAYDPTASAGSGKNMTQIMAAEDAKLYVDGLLVTKSSNTINDVIAGTTINLLKTNTGSQTKVNVTSDSSAALTGIDNFVKAYNDLNKTINDLTRYNPDTKQAGALQGDGAMREVATDIRNGLTQLVSGAVGAYKALPQIGLSFDRNGVLTADAAKLQAAMKADPTAVQSLFASAGVVDDSLVSYAGSTTASRAGSYALNVSQIATKGTATGSAVAGLTIDGTNDTLSLSVNGVATTVKLAQATYTASSLVAELQSKINGSASLISAGASVSISETGGVLTLTSNKYGSASKVAITGGNGADNLFGVAPTITAGLDVAGTLGGYLANGSGQRLTGTGPTDGLKLDVAGGATGQRGTLRYGVGIAGQLDQMITKLLGSKGLIASRNESLQNQVKAIDADRDRINQRLEVVEKRYTAQFNSLDQQLSSMQSTSAYLAQQLASIASIK
ncbi:MAG TPA: flagellar filament capping protein FliD [Polyangiales bacterium]|nr:flagellar filament capping protein FliD [Polyangiales bacterium]